jgi:hypothetical protein
MTDCCTGFRPQCSELKDVAIIGCIPENCTFIVNHCNTSCDLKYPSGCSISGESKSENELTSTVLGIIGGFSFIMLVIFAILVYRKKLRNYSRSDQELDITDVDDDRVVRLEDSLSNSTDSQA